MSLGRLNVALLLLLLLFMDIPALPQSSGGFIDGQVLTAGELNLALSKKTDYPPSIFSSVNAWTALQAFSAGATTLTQNLGDSSTNVASTAFVQRAQWAPSIIYWGNTNTCNGTTDDTATFVAAAAAVPLFSLPPNKTCVISSPFTLSSTPGMGIIGAGEGSSIININSTTAEGVIVPAGAVEPLLRDFQITRTGTATSGATNLDISGGTSGGLFENLIIKNGYNNITLGPTDHGQMRHVLSELAQNHCFALANTAGNGTMQWQFYNDNLAVQCGGDDFNLTVVAGPAQITFGEWVSVQTFANTGHGISINCLLTASLLTYIPCNGLRIRQPFLGADGADELNLNTFNTTGGTHIIESPDIELAGTQATGPTLGTPASNAATAITISANNGEINLINPTITNISTDGIYNLGTAGNYTAQGTPILNVNGGSITNVGLAGNVSLARGIANLGSGETIFRGVRSGNLAGTTQQYVITFSASTVHNNVIDNDLRGNSTTAIFNASTDTTNRFESNVGYNPVGVTNSTTVGTSPATICAGPTRETHYYSQAMTNTATVQLGSISGPTVATLVASMANVPAVVELGPNECTYIVWSMTAPTYAKSVR
jgi:hypothetical protein